MLAEPCHDYLAATQVKRPESEIWLPAWAR
jgi:hypothetical protein